MLFKNSSICGKCGKTYYNDEKICTECNTSLTPLPKGTIFIKKEKYRPAMIFFFSIGLILLLTGIFLSLENSSLFAIAFGFSLTAFTYGCKIRKSYRQTLLPDNKTQDGKEDLNSNIPLNVSKADKNYTLYIFIFIFIFIVVVYFITNL